MRYLRRVDHYLIPASLFGPILSFDGGFEQCQWRLQSLASNGFEPLITVVWLTPG